MANNIEVKDANGVSRVVKTIDRANVHTQVMEAELSDPYVNLDVDENGVVVTPVKAQFHNWSVHNMSPDWRYLKFYDKATTPTAGDTPKLVWPIPPTTMPIVGGVLSGFQFLNGIGLRATTGLAHSDTGAPGTNDVIVNLGYRAG